MNKKILMVATYGDFFASFEVNNIKILNQLGYEVHLCANWENTKYNYKHEKLKGLKFKKINIHFDRSPFSLKNLINYKKLSRLMKYENYKMVDCHNAVIGAYSRIAAKVNNVEKIMYTAHGYQFFKGGKLLDWVLYYPIEKILSNWTDELVVINKEDFHLAKKRMKAKRIDVIPGVGFDYDKFKVNTVNVKEKKKEVGIPLNSFVILSVGELSKRKNHEVIIRAISKIDKLDIYYIIAGQGSQYASLRNLSKKLGIEDRVKLLGHRDDIRELNAISNIAAFPSKREGLGIAALESLAAGLPLISSNVQGIKDYSIDGITGFTCHPEDIEKFAEHILRLYSDEKLVKLLSENGRKISTEFSIGKVSLLMQEIYETILS
ncbi:glycosyltransferase family 4 protein [Enterococcus faecium]|uniref:glycosyltransferase n=1 Tax=Enterococcus faecium TaxID=1352 RepID=UPI00100DC31F|nr:glycosyltransferase [Enterococcus faecium]KAA9182420.1 glycosyltransferase family 4 protein [Enterococcus faecium]MDG4624950.1 glycosyltransferase [Enterococcus faecium]RXW54144.1 glycosyltransferase family 1 protein [Enterococcus faecium]